jgi:chromosome segregation ATPase
MRSSNALVKEVILENFMSHKYSRIPLRPGLNLVCGPNGAGKSSILLGLAVTLGQTYTERSRKLGDLIRRGENLGRVSLVFDNSLHEGKRPIPHVNTDTVVLSRYLSRDGNYWHEINNRTVMKGEVLRLLERFSINPDNLLIIMHQNMIDIFGAIDPQEKLKLVEEAVGMKDYRERIIEAMQKLSHALSEEESIASLLEKAKETLHYWEGEYQRFEKRRGLEARKGELEVEHAWAKHDRQGEAVENLLAKIHRLNAELGEINGDLDQNSQQEKKLEAELEKLDFEIDSSYQRLIEHERTQAEKGAEVKLVESLKGSLKNIQTSEIKSLVENLGADAARAKTGLKEAEEKAKTIESGLVELKKRIVKSRESYINSKVQVAVLGFRKELLEKEISGMQGDLRRARRELEQLEAEAKKVGARVKTERKPQEVLDELRVVNAQLMTFSDVSPDVERMYLSYKSTIKELEGKARVAEANRRRALEDLELRKKRWQNEIARLLKEVKEGYLKLLERVHATGDVKFINQEDIEETGLEIWVGFRGAEPRLLDAYAQSGGERTTSLMCFLLALQRLIKSPLRAIDEFEAHLDPHNREQIMQSIVDSMKDEAAQYILITPGQLVNVENVPNVVTVQNVAGSSQVKVVT